MGGGLLSLQLVAFGGHGCLLFDILSDSLLYFLCVLLHGCLLPSLACTVFLGCLLDLLPLEGLAKWHLATAMDFLTFMLKGHSSKFKVSR